MQSEIDSIQAKELSDKLALALEETTKQADEMKVEVHKQALAYVEGKSRLWKFLKSGTFSYSKRTDVEKRSLLLDAWYRDAIDSYIWELDLEDQFDVRHYDLRETAHKLLGTIIKLDACAHVGSPITLTHEECIFIYDMVKEDGGV